MCITGALVHPHTHDAHIKRGGLRGLLFLRLSVYKMVLQLLFCVLHLLDVVPVDAVVQEGQEGPLGGTVPFVEAVQPLLVEGQEGVDLLRCFSTALRRSSCRALGAFAVRHALAIFSAALLSSTRAEAKARTAVQMPAGVKLSISPRPPQSAGWPSMPPTP